MLHSTPAVSFLTQHAWGWVFGCVCPSPFLWGIWIPLQEIIAPEDLAPILFKSSLASSASFDQQLRFLWPSGTCWLSHPVNWPHERVLAKTAGMLESSHAIAYMRHWPLPWKLPSKPLARKVLWATCVGPSVRTLLT